MRAYQPFSICTLEALLYTEKIQGVVLAENRAFNLMQQYKQLPPFAERGAWPYFTKTRPLPASRVLEWRSPDGPRRTRQCQPFTRV